MLLKDQKVHDYFECENKVKKKTVNYNLLVDRGKYNNYEKW